jgi:hypothetical protein
MKSLPPIPSGASAHLDLTTLIAALDALGELPATAKKPISFYHILALSQLLESIVLYDRLFYESSALTPYQPYMELLESAEFQRRWGKGWLGVHENREYYGLLESDAIRWAVSQIYTPSGKSQVDMSALRWAVDVRDASLRSVELAKNIRDTDNPHQQQYEQIVHDTGDKNFVNDFRQARLRLESNSIGLRALHVLVRLKLLVRWLSSRTDLTYLPHFSRIPILQSTMLHSQGPTEVFRKWTVEEIRSNLRSLWSSTRALERVSDLTLKLSPILLACLESAQRPADVLANALELREASAAFRQFCRSTEQAAAEGRIDAFRAMQQVKAELSAFNASLEEEIRRTGASYPDINVDVSLTGVAFSVDGKSLARSIKRTPPRGVHALLGDILTRSLGIVRAESRLARVFYVSDSVDEYLISRL